MKCKSGLHGQSNHLPDLSTPDQFKRLETRQAEVIKGEIEAALAKAREYGADIFGFGQQLYGHDNRAWQRLAADWERHFREATVEIKVKAVLVELGLTTRPVLD